VLRARAAAGRPYAAIALFMFFAQMALAFVTGRPFVTANIIGATTMEQLKSNIASSEMKLSQAVLDGIDAVHKVYTYPCP